MAARLGQVIYWFACGAALIWGTGAVAVGLMDWHGPAPPMAGVAFVGATGAAFFWLIGRAFLYVLAGR